MTWPPAGKGWGAGPGQVLGEAKGKVLETWAAHDVQICEARQVQQPAALPAGLGGPCQARTQLELKAADLRAAACQLIKLQLPTSMHQEPTNHHVLQRWKFKRRCHCGMLQLRVVEAQ